MVVGEWACGAVAHGAVRRGESGSRAFVGGGRLARARRTTEVQSMAGARKLGRRTTEM